ncbi:lipoate--protein ligase family protein [Enterovirga rhinocerotis]|uniref:BPL/LPL catalytic domain-containing protein n=1 Tax=Enterovirga rhinocerotis TaxID=1339210 RepID=A0A4R7BK32_9HYPH|nr:hypothetical protein [Enterovirga rhinocerotis]TDR84565.1 hypothetical protein EV668_4926 [Enterovirga rhinocerotis]
MSGRLRILGTGLGPARWNVATSAALLRSIDDGGCDTLRFYRFPMACVIGRNQDAGIELDLPACEAEGVEIARRVTGGGAVIMGPGILAFDLVLGTQGRDIHQITRRAGEALTAALTALGFPAILATPGSVEIGGRKISGSAGRLGRRAALHQATLILDLAEAPPLALLRRRTEAGKPTPDPTHRVTSLAAEAAGAAPSAPDPSPAGEGESAPADRGGVTPRRSSPHPGSPREQVRARLGPPLWGGIGAARLEMHLARAFAEAFDLAPEPGDLTAAERALAAEILAREAGRDDYVLENARPMEVA